MTPTSPSPRKKVPPHLPTGGRLHTAEPPSVANETAALGDSENADRDLLCAEIDYAAAP